MSLSKSSEKKSSPSRIGPPDIRRKKNGSDKSPQWRARHRAYRREIRRQSGMDRKEERSHESFALMMQRRMRTFFTKIRKSKKISRDRVLLADEKILQKRMRWISYAIRRLHRGRYPSYIPTWLADSSERSRVFSI